jgi:DNA-binding CsgD family transcriptional regulator
MPAAAAAILDGMPDARDLHRLDSGGQTMIFAGPVQLFWYAEEDTATRNVAVAVLRQLGFGGAEVAAVMGLTPNYVATLRQRSLREGTAGLIRAAGRPRETGEASWDRARAWRAAGMRDSEIARRLGVNQSTVLRRLGRKRCRSHRNRPPQSRNQGNPGPGNPGSRSRSKQQGRGLPARIRPRGRRLSPPGMRGRCCCTRSSRGRPPGRCSPALPGRRTWRC